MKDFQFRILLISGHVLERMGIVDKVASLMGRRGLSCVKFTDVTANPRSTTMKDIMALYRRAMECIVMVLTSRKGQRTRRSGIRLQMNQSSSNKVNIKNIQ